MRWTYSVEKVSPLSSIARTALVHDRFVLALKVNGPVFIFAIAFRRVGVERDINNRGVVLGKKIVRTNFLDRFPFGKMGNARIHRAKVRSSSVERARRRKVMCMA